MSLDKSELSKPKKWLSLSKAAEMLGVHSMTLRRWSDSGQFPVFRTPGGHRRYSLEDIRNYLAKNSSDIPEPAENGSAWVNTALVQTRQQVVTQPQKHRWLRGISDESLRDEYRQMGRQLMGLLLQYVAAEEPDDSFLDEAVRIGRIQAAYGLREGLSLSALMEATFFFRDILIESSLEMPSTISLEPNSNVRILRRINRLINAVQLAVADCYEEAHGGGDEGRF